ncbi:hypothetical protein CSA56_05350 [candidate division KSB3 bacterium]|uniref:DUF4352 domain-containing protein n=1 Tax=candidate division KSB3 bacterium TaxID=2044937 RepID=A0A2G6KHM9_9BACT|nr:MAG: hypothetical protein CSA56_05350 [candidate division KSB3 bacterium]
MKRIKMVVTVGLAGVILGAILFGCSGSTTEDFLPNVTLSINALIFEVPVDSFQIQTVTIKNLSTKNVTIERITSTNDDVFRVGGYFTNNELVELETPFAIEGNGARAIYIGFYPEEESEYQGKIVVESIDINSNSETDLLDLTGTGLPDPD